MKILACIDCHTPQWVEPAVERVWCEKCAKKPVRPMPVTDHMFEGDGSPDPTWCSCGRSISEHLRRPV